MKSFQSIVVILWAFSGGIRANAAILSLACLIQTGALDNESKIHEKPLTFPTIDQAAQQQFVSGLTEVAAISTRHRNNQCHFACGNFSFATFLTKMAPPSFKDQVSGAYITAKTFENKFLNHYIHEGQLVSSGTNPEKVHTAARQHGVLTEEQYPSRSNINTPLLVTTLNKIAKRYNAERKKHSSTPERVDALNVEALELASSVIQFFFGKYPQEIRLNGARTSAVEQYDMIVRGVSAQPLRHQRLGSFSQFEQQAPVALKSGLPILVSYRIDDATPPDGIYRSLGKPWEGYSHLTVLTGILRDNQGQTYYRLQNSHRNAPDLYFEQSYLAARFREGIFWLPPRYEARFEAAENPQ